MKISTRGRYALRALVDLSIISVKEKKYISLKQVALRQDISMKYLETLFAILRNSGIIKSVQGAQGGYLLARSPREITVLEVLNAIEGAISVVECCVSKTYCDKKRKCKTYKVWNKVNDAMYEIFGKTTIQDLI
jgi:Rrf2 family protein